MQIVKLRINKFDNLLIKPNKISLMLSGVRNHLLLVCFQLLAFIAL